MNSIVKLSSIKLSSQSIRQWSTPQLLKGGLVVTGGTGLFFLATILMGVQAQRNALKTVGLDAAPSIMNAQRIQDSLADMDANVANELLAKLGQNQAAVDDYNKRREKLATLLVAVAENITYDDQERIPIQTIQAKVGDYIQLIQQARDFHARGDEAAMRQAYRAASEIMDNTLLPAADQLAEVNNTQMNSTYQRQGQWLVGYLFLVLISGLLLLGTLVGLQLFLNHRMRRILNPGLLAASTIALLLLGYTVQSLSGSSFQLKVVKEDAFDSLYALRKARSLAYRANADESRYLLDPQMAQKHEEAFQQKVDLIAKVPAGMTLNRIADIASTNRSRSFQINGFQGFLADELANITFGEPERAVVIETLRTFGTYLEIDQQIRNLERRGQHQQAISLCLGNNPNQSDWAFDQYRAAHQEVLNVNMAEFQDAIQRGFQQVGVNVTFKIPVQPGILDPAAKAANEDIHALDTKQRVEAGALTRFEVVAASAIGAIALLTLLGLLPRLKEYSS